MTSKLITQADGRAFAIALLEKGGGSQEGVSACPYNPTAATNPHSESEDFELLRTGPQWDGLYRDLEFLIANGTEEARKGFACILTDYLCGGGEPTYDYREWEALGRFQDFGEPGSAWECKARDPKFADLPAIKSNVIQLARK